MGGLVIGDGVFLSGASEKNCRGEDQKETNPGCEKKRKQGGGFKRPDQCGTRGRQLTKGMGKKRGGKGEGRGDENGTGLGPGGARSRALSGCHGKEKTSQLTAL